MKIHLLYEKFWTISENEEPEKMINWIDKLLIKEKENIDLRFLKLEILRWNHLDVEDDSEEPIVMLFCTDIIRNREKELPITVAKAYAYRGDMKYLKIDRVKDFNKAKDILDNLNKKDKEVNFINQFINARYQFEFRQYLSIDTNYRNMFIF